MNKARLLLLMLLLATLSGSVCMHPATLRVVEIPDAKMYYVPANYYNYASIIPPGVDPFEWLENLKWDREYAKDEWDCSNMALYIEWVLENAGIPAKIYAGYGHAWVVVWRTDVVETGEWVAFECVGLHWIHPWSNGRYYHPVWEWDSIYNLRKWHGCHSYAFAREWCWWADTDILWPDD